MTITPAEILDFWFEGDPAVRREKWFEKQDAFDTACARYIAAIRAARAGAFDDWSGAAKTGLARIILLDQLPRNVFRGRAEAFASDPVAVAAARAMVARGFDTGLAPLERMFVYLPFEHSEAPEDQDESVRLFETSRADLGERTVDYAHRHRDVIRRFGRFPHRNAVLGRASTPAELAYLAEPGAGF
jgi:uncharacterized protein (DUF924 family)